MTELQKQYNNLPLDVKKRASVIHGLCIEEILCMVHNPKITHQEEMQISQAITQAKKDLRYKY